MRCSMLIRVSVPEPPVACAPAMARLAVTPVAGDAVGPGDGVGAGATVEDVVAGAGVEEVVEVVAGEVGGAGGEDARVLDVGPEGVAEPRVKTRSAAARRAGIGFGDDVADVVDVVEVAAVAADHGVGAAAAVEGVVAGAAAQRCWRCRCRSAVVVRRAGEVLEVEHGVGTRTAGRPAGATVARLTVTPAVAVTATPRRPCRYRRHRR
jgi:hypothetical protein